MNLMDVPVTLVLRGRTTGTDEYGEPIRDPETRTPALCWLDAGDTTENGDAAETRTNAYTIRLPLDTELRAGDGVELPHDGPGIWNVIGEVMRQPGGFIVKGYAFARVERVRG